MYLPAMLIPVKNPSTTFIRAWRDDHHGGNARLFRHLRFRAGWDGISLAVIRNSARIAMTGDP